MIQMYAYCIIKTQLTGMNSDYIFVLRWNVCNNMDCIYSDVVNMNIDEII